MSLQHSEEDWQLQAACRGPGAAPFFPPPHFERKDDRLRREAKAKAICGSCRVRESCLEYELQIREPHGVWGGYNEAERKVLLGR